jgi:hypothetical protein
MHIKISRIIAKKEKLSGYIPQLLKEGKEENQFKRWQFSIWKGIDFTSWKLPPNR